MKSKGLRALAGVFSAVMLVSALAMPVLAAPAAPAEAGQSDTAYAKAKNKFVKSKLTVKRKGKKVSGKTATVLARIVMAEVGGFRNKEVYKAQAIAAHTFLLYQYAQGNKYPTVPDATPTKMCKDAVASVAHMVLTYGGEPAFTPYYASSNGKTNPCKDFWKQNFKYLKTVSSKYDKGATGFKATKTISTKDFKAMMDRVYGKGNYDLGSNPAKWVKVKRNKAGYVTTVTVGGRTPTVEYFYQTMMKLRSPDFTIKYNKSGDTLTFTTKGYGHGVGMSQWGAYFYATKKKYKYNKILSHYYPGTKLVK